MPIGQIDDAPDAQHAPEPQQAEPQEEPDQQVDNLAILLVLLIAGGLLRLVLGLLGPLQGLDTATVAQTRERGEAVLNASPGNAYPLFDLLTLGILNIGLPAWCVVLIGSLLSLLAIPAAYLIGLVLTGRRFAGLFAAAVVAVHPAVLTVSNTFASQAIALGLVTIGLACVCLADKRGPRTTLVGAGLLGIAGLTAPLCWLVGALAGPLIFRLSLRHGLGRALGLGVIATLLAIAPAAAYRSALLGYDAASLLAEWHSEPAQTNTPAPADRLLVTMTHPSFVELGDAMHLPVGDAGRLQVTSTRPIDPSVRRDPVADALADGWLLLNSAIAGLAAISIGVMAIRRRFAEVLVLAVPLIAMAWSTLPPSEMLRLPLFALVGVLAMGLLAKRPVVIIDEAKREAKRLAKIERQEQKERAKQERELEKHKDNLYAFDKQDRRQTKDRRQVKPEPTEAIPTEVQEEPAPQGARPI
ncbi:MAG: hypothetical protein AAF711_14155 [Planctomycetota bacterium]